MSASLVRRISQTPVVSYGAVPGYGAIFNAGLFAHDHRLYLTARAVRVGYRANPIPGDRFVDYISDILLFTSDDAQHFIYDSVLLSATPGECYEDPRVQLVTDPDGAHLLLTFTVLPDDRSQSHYVGLRRLNLSAGHLSLADAATVRLGPPGVPNKDAVLFNLTHQRVGLLQRIHPDIQLAAAGSLADLLGATADSWDAYLASLADHVVLGCPSDALGLGAGAPLVPTPAGLLMFYHVRQADGAYTMNLALLDPDTGAVTSRLPYPVLTPTLEWECQGDVPNVVFVTGAVSFADQVYLTYGAADSCVGAATAHLPELLAALAIDGVSTPARTLVSA